MNETKNSNKSLDCKRSVSQGALTRRRFCADMITASAAAAFGAGLPASAGASSKVETERRIKIGIVGLGGRGKWIAGLFKAHGGYELAAAADYFEAVVQKQGEQLGVPATKRFSGLSGYKRVLDTGVEALVIEDVPCFYPEQASAAVEAGRHVYVAKPIAVDVPGVRAMEAAANKATAKKLCFLVDYQLPTDAGNQEVAKRVRDGALGTLAHIYSGGLSSRWTDPERESTIENLLRGGAWLSHVNLGGDNIVSYDIHIVDGVTWVMDKCPLGACGISRAVEKHHGDRTDCGGVVFQYDDGMFWTHITQALKNNAWIYNLAADFMGVRATAHVAYWGKIHIRGGPQHYAGSVSAGIYEDGAKTNIAEFYRCITGGDFSNPTARRAVEGTLTAILGREAMARKTFLTKDELIRENKKLKVDLRGLKT